MIVGVDEAGRGPLAGPVVAAAVLLCKPRPSGLDDSKKLTAARRAELETTIKRRCQWAVGVVDVEDLVDGNMTPAGRRPEWRWNARAIVGGDAIEPCISAASIIAKEHRDRIMCAAAQQHAQYGWEKNKGYGTPDHLAALRAHGPTPLHRKSFAPVSQMVLL